MKTLFSTICILVLTIAVDAQDTIKLSDFESLNNTSWKGSLTYIDYQSEKPETVNATMQLKIVNDKIISNVQYTYEPKKNNKVVVKIKKNGTYFGNEKVINFSKTNGVRTLKTIYQAKDNGKKANVFVTHTLTDSTYVVITEIEYLGTNQRFTRNSYNYKKIE